MYLHFTFRGTLFWNAKCCRSFDGGVAFASTRSVRLSSQLFQFRPKQSLRERGSSKQWVEILSGGSILRTFFAFVENLRLSHNYLQFSHNLNLRTNIWLVETSVSTKQNIHWRPKSLGWQAILLSKMAPVEVGMWLPWWWPAHVLPAPGSWGLF